MPPMSMASTSSDVIEEQPEDIESPEGQSSQDDSASPAAVPAYSYKLQSGDPVVVYLRGIYPKDDMIEDIVDDGGNITLPHLGDFLVAGKSTSQAEAEIRTRYIREKIYTTITVNLVMPQKTYFIQGEVRNPGRFPIVGGMTLMQAIAAAGGYTEFASPRNVVLNRAGKKTEVNMRRIQKNPEQDIRLESGDVIVVERSIF